MKRIGKTLALALACFAFLFYHPSTGLLLRLFRHSTSDRPPILNPPPVSEPVTEEVSAYIRQQLPFLPANVRFFVTYVPLAESGIRPDTRKSPAGKFFALIDGGVRLDLQGPDDFVKVHLVVRSMEDAHKLATFYNYVQVGIRAAPKWSVELLPKFPVNSACFSIIPPPDSFGILDSEKVSTRIVGNEKIFEIDRFAYDASLEFGYRGKPVKALRVIELIYPGGRFSRSIVQIPTPGLEVERHCFPR
jgi:hypothetical protein